MYFLIRIKPHARTHPIKYSEEISCCLMDVLWEVGCTFHGRFTFPQCPLHGGCCQRGKCALQLSFLLPGHLHTINPHTLQTQCLDYLQLSENAPNTVGFHWQLGTLVTVGNREVCVSGKGIAGLSICVFRRKLNFFRVSMSSDCPCCLVQGESLELSMFPYNAGEELAFSTFPRSQRQE